MPYSTLEVFLNIKYYLYCLKWHLLHVNNTNQLKKYQLHFFGGTPTVKIKILFFRSFHQKTQHSILPKTYRKFFSGLFETCNFRFQREIYLSPGSAVLSCVYFLIEQYFCFLLTKKKSEQHEGKSDTSQQKQHLL